MQHLDRSWNQQYVNAPSARNTPYYARTGYNELGLDTPHQDDSQAQDTQLGAWKHGSKRMRPNDYGLHNVHSPNRQSPSEVPHYGPVHGAPDMSSSFADQLNPLDYNQANTHQHGYTNLMPMGGLRHASSVDDQALPLGPYDSISHSVQDPLAGTDGGLRGSSRVSYSSDQQDTSYAPPQDLPPQHAESMSSSYNAPSLAQSRFGYGAEEEYASPQAVQSTGLMNPFAQMNEWGTSQYSYNAGLSRTNIEQEHSGLYGKDASLHLKLQSLVILDNLATQIIMNLAKPSLAEIEQLTTGEDSEESQAYVTRKSLFDQTRKVYSRDTPFIDAIAIQLFTPHQQEIVRKANKATFISSILEGHDVSFYDLNEYFLEIFVPVGQRLLKWQGGIFLDLKTQVYISALMNSDGPGVESLLDELFPDDLEDRITARHPDAPNLAPSESDFIERAKQRKQYLKDEAPETAVSTLPLKYTWNDFLKEFASCVSKNVETLLTPPQRQPSSSGQSQLTGELRRPGSSALRMTSYSSNGPGRGVHTAGSISEIAPSDTRQSIYDSLGGIVFNNAPSTNAATNSSASSTTNENARGSKQPKATNTSAPRQPWKNEEEKALLDGLAEVKGPHWSQILSLYGRGGSISEVLKDRSQIQLKDKARNLKLWYLKVGNEVPACLQGVTGELRKRGGARVRAQLGLKDTEGSDGGGSTREELSRQSSGGTAATAASTAAIDPALSGR